MTKINATITKILRSEPSTRFFSVGVAASLADNKTARDELKKEVLALAGNNDSCIGFIGRNKNMADFIDLICNLLVNNSITLQFTK